MNEQKAIAGQRELIKLIESQQFEKAVRLGAETVRLAPRMANSHYLLGVALLALNHAGPAIKAFEKALLLTPGRLDYLTEMAKAQAADGRHLEAKKFADQALKAGKRTAYIADALGRVYSMIGLNEAARDMFEEAAKLNPNSSVIFQNLGSARSFIGDKQGAKEAFERAIEISPTQGKSHWTLSRLEKQTPEKNNLDRLTKLDRDLSSDNPERLYLHYAFAKEYEDLGEYDKAFEHIQRGSVLKRRSISFSMAEKKRSFEAIKKQFDKSFVGATADKCPTAPIFVLGMPRSGTTLVEQIFGGAPGVRLGGELLAFPLAFRIAAGAESIEFGDEKTIMRAGNVDYDALAEQYTALARQAVGEGDFRFTDKLPQNFLHVGAIAKALPKASIVHVMRGAIATCFANFKQLFGDGLLYSYDQIEVADYYAEYRALMDHWRDVLPGRLVDVEYEALVSDPSSVGKVMVEGCDLPWDDDYLTFYKKKNIAATASAAQVREPVHGGAVQSWKNFEKHLQPMIDRLNKHGLI